MVTRLYFLSFQKISENSENIILLLLECNYISKIRKKKDKNLLSLFLFLANSSTPRPGKKQKANMLYLSKLATNKDASFKMQLLLSSKDDDKCPTETIWCRNGFSGDQKVEFTITKANFPENTLIYINNGTISIVKGRDYAIYLDYIILGQLICAKNLPEDFENYECKQDEVKLFVPNYNVKTGDFLDVQNWLAYIMVRGDEHETFLSYDFQKEKSKMLYSTLKQPLPNIFQGSSFKKHYPMLLNEGQVQDFSTLFFFLPSTTDRKEKINKFMTNVSLHHIDVRYEDFQKYSRNRIAFKPQDLDSTDLEKKAAAREIVLNHFKEAVAVSNSNLVRNVRTFLLRGTTNIDSEEFKWLGEPKLVSDKFKCTY